MHATQIMLLLILERARASPTSYNIAVLKRLVFKYMNLEVNDDVKQQILDFYKKQQQNPCITVKPTAIQKSSK